MKATQFVNRQKDFCPKDFISLFPVRTVQQNHDGEPYAVYCGVVCLRIGECGE